MHNKFIVLALSVGFAAFGACSPPTMAPPPACPMEPCISHGTMPPPVGGNNPTDAGTEGGVLDSGTPLIDGGQARMVNGAVAEVRVFPRLRRATDTVVGVGWRVTGLLGSADLFSTSDAMGAFSLMAPADGNGVIPLKAVSADGRNCVITTTQSAAGSHTLLALTSGRLADASAPTGFTLDPARAQLVVELDDIPDRIRDVFVELEVPAPVAVAVDTLDSALAIGNATHTLGTAILYNLDAPATGRAMNVRLRRANGSTRLASTYVARGCVSWLRTSPP